MKPASIYEAREWVETGFLLLALLLALKVTANQFLGDEPDPEDRPDPPAHLTIDRDLLDAMTDGDLDGETLAETAELVGEELGNGEEETEE